MSYRLRPDESIPDGLRRLARKELRSAREQLQPRAARDEAIHEARKSVKKVRAILQLVEADDGRGVSDSEKRLRKIGRALSRLRDTGVAIETLATLKREEPGVFKGVYASLRRHLMARKRDAARAAARDAVFQDAARQLKKLRKMAAGWRPAHSKFGALAAGITRAHRNGRKAMVRAQRHRHAVDFHEWRKQIKRLWYELRLLEGGRTWLARDVRALNRAETWLGEDHNIVVLRDRLIRDPSLCRKGGVDVKQLRRAAARYQRRLRQKAIASTRRIYSATPSAYVKRIKRAWRMFRNPSGRRRR
jgi:CHAD domain-containing protein